MMKEGTDAKTKIGEKTVFSLYVVIVLITVAIWIVRLSDRVEEQERLLTEIRDTIKDLSGRLSAVERHGNDR